MLTLTKAIDCAPPTNLSHTERNTLRGAIESFSNKIQQRGDLSYITIARQLELLQELSAFELGRFLLRTGGLNGYWINYIVNHPKNGRLTGLNSENQHFSELEVFLLDQAPTCLATQQRFEIFKREIQTRLHDGVALASIPCGLTTDLLDLDFSQVPEFSITGIDIDPEALVQSQQIAENLGLTGHCQFVYKDAWALGYEKTFDVISSNGLSIYEPDNNKIVELYQQFFAALKPNGYLVTSFLTPPPIPQKKTEWDLKNVNCEHALLQKIVFADILECKWQAYRSEELVRSQLTDAGFTEIEVFYDQAHIFPTVIATKKQDFLLRATSKRNSNSKFRIPFDKFLLC